MDRQPLAVIRADRLRTAEDGTAVSKCMLLSHEGKDQFHVYATKGSNGVVLVPTSDPGGWGVDS